MRSSVALAIAFVLSTVVAGQQPGRPGARTPPPKIPAPKTSARPAPPPAREAEVPFRVGETLTYDVSWSQFLTAGTAVSKVIEKKPASGSTAYAVVADGRPLPLVARFYPVYYKMDSLIDSFSVLSHESSLYTEEKGKTRQSNMRFDRAARRVFYEAPSESMKQNFEVPANVQDGLATLYAVRAHAFKPGEHFSIPVADDGSLYSVEIDTSVPERVRVPMGDVEAWNLKLTIVDDKRQPAAKNTAVWISTDTRRLPVKLQSDLPVGSFVLALREARP
jgi:uncharacterized protein DUF3108